MLIKKEGDVYLYNMDTKKTKELKQYILNKLAIVGITEKEVEKHIHFTDRCNGMGFFAYFKEDKYYFVYMGFREAECSTDIYDTKDEILKQCLITLAVNPPRGDYQQLAVEWALQMGLDVDV